MRETRGGKPDEKENETERKRVGVRRGRAGGTVGVRSFGALVLRGREGEGAESVQEKAGGSIQPLESSRDYASGLRVLCSAGSPHTHTQTICSHTQTRAIFSFPLTPKNVRVRVKTPRTDHHFNLQTQAKRAKRKRRRESERGRKGWKVLC